MTIFAHMMRYFKSAALAALSVMVSSAAAGAQTVSDFYSCTSNCRAATVYEIGPEGDEVCFVNITRRGRQRITVTASEAIQSFSILPESANITGKAKGDRLTFTAKGRKKLHIKVNDLPCLELTTEKPEKKAELKSVRADYHYSSGEHNVGTLDLKDGDIVRIEEGAIVHANIVGEGDNITICGRGILHGTVKLQNCDNLHIKDITVCNDVKSWTNTLTCCTNSSYTNVKVFSCGAIYSQDGINPVACKGFTIEDCLIHSVDDCIAIKSFVADKDGDMGTRDITVKHCVMVGKRCADGVTIGFELNGGEVKDILVNDCDILKADGGGMTGGHSAFSIVCDGAADVHDIVYDDIRTTADIDPKNLEIIITDGNMYGPDDPGQIHDITIRNVNWANESKPFIIQGYEDHIVRGITFENCTLAGKPLKSTSDAIFKIEKAEEISFK